MWLMPCSSRRSSTRSAVAWSTRPSAAAPKITAELLWPVRPKDASRSSSAGLPSRRLLAASLAPPAARGAPPRRADRAERVDPPAGASRSRSAAKAAGPGRRAWQAVRIADMNWMQVEEYLRARRPRGAAARQHRAAQPPAAHRRLHPPRAGRGRGRRAARRAGLSGGAVRASRPYFREFPARSRSGRDPPARLVGDILDGLAHSGFRRILIVNGHGGNNAVQRSRPSGRPITRGCRVLFHNWWNAPRTWAKVQAIDPVASHGRGWRTFRGRASPA